MKVLTFVRTFNPQSGRPFDSSLLHRTVLLAGELSSDLWRFRYVKFFCFYAQFYVINVFLRHKALSLIFFDKIHSCRSEASEFIIYNLANHFGMGKNLLKLTFSVLVDGLWERSLRVFRGTIHPRPVHLRHELVHSHLEDGRKHGQGPVARCRTHSEILLPKEYHYEA
jgi:hypothetical protein